MSLIRHVISGCRSLLFKRTADRDLDDEVRQYIEAATQEHMRAGLSRQDAERAARVDFGGIENAKDVVRAGGWEFLVESGIRDLQYAVRSLRAAPGYAIAAVGILGTGIALTTSVLTVSSTVLRQQWPVADPARVVTVLAAKGGPGFSPAEAKYFGELTPIGPANMINLHPGLTIDLGNDTTLGLVGIRYWRLSTKEPAYSLTGGAIPVSGNESLVGDQAEITVERQFRKSLDVLVSLSRFEPSEGAKRGRSLKATTMFAVELNLSV